jgi:hypothetical protein
MGQHQKRATAPERLCFRPANALSSKNGGRIGVEAISSADSRVRIETTPILFFDAAPQLLKSGIFPARKYFRARINPIINLFGRCFVVFSLYNASP